jgi:putative hydrolase of the HAD superfamily
LNISVPEKYTNTMSAEIRAIIKRHADPLEPIVTDTQPVLRKLSGIKAVLFDVYGTLLIGGVGEIGTSREKNSEKAFSEALCVMEIRHDSQALRGIEWLADAIKKSHAWSRDKGIEYPEVDILAVWSSVLEELRTRGLIEGKEHDVSFLRKLAVEYEMRSNPVWPMPGCRDCLESLRESGFHLGLVSNAQFFTPELFPALLDAELCDLGFRDELLLFSFHSQHAKPGPFMFEHARKILARFGVDAGATLYIGNDMLNDVYAASHMGFRTALFAGDQRSLRLRRDDSRLAGISPDLVLTDLHQLLQCLPLSCE